MAVVLLSASGDTPGAIDVYECTRGESFGVLVEATWDAGETGDWTAFTTWEAQAIAKSRPSAVLVDCTDEGTTDTDLAQLANLDTLDLPANEPVTIRIIGDRGLATMLVVYQCILTAREGARA